MNAKLLALALGATLLFSADASEAKTYRRGDFKPAAGGFPGCNDDGFAKRVKLLTDGKNATGFRGHAVTFRSKLYPAAAGTVTKATGTLGSTIDAFVVQGRPWTKLLQITPKRTSGSGYFDVQVCGYMTSSRVSGSPPDFLPTDSGFTNHHDLGFGVEATPVPFQMGFEPPATTADYLMYWVVYVIPRSRVAGGSYELAVRGG